MLLTQKTDMDLVRSLMTDSSPTQLVTEEGLPVGVPSSLLKLFSPLLRDLLSLPPCLTTSIIIPGTDLNTLSLLLDLLKEGTSSKSFTSIEPIQDLASSLGIDLRGLKMSSGGSVRPSGGQVTITSQPRQSQVRLRPTSNPKKVVKPNKINMTKVRTKKSDLLRNIKEEKNEEANNGGIESEKSLSSHVCQICEKTFQSVTPLAWHYCKHFSKELNSFNFPDLVEDNKCSKCDRTFADRQAILSHMGVKHKYINHVLSANGLNKLQLGKEQPAGGPTGVNPVRTTIKVELPGVGVTGSEAGSGQRPRKVPRVSLGSKGRNCKEVKEIKVCEICDKEQDNMSKLVNHMISSHLLTEIKQKYAHLYNGKECLECNKPLPRASVWQHIGSVHNKLDEVLIERGLRPIKVPLPLSIRTVIVKTEQMEEEQVPGEEQELQINNLFASYEAVTVEGEETTEMEMASDPLL